MANADRIDSGLRRNPSLSIRPDLAKAAHAVTGQNNQDELLGPRGDWWWTGKCPADCPGFDAKAGVLRSLPMPSTHNYTRQALLDYFDNTWTLTEVLFASLQGYDAFVRQPYHQLRHPMMFYYNHPSVLYINKFRVAGLLDEGIDPYFEQVRQLHKPVCLSTYCMFLLHEVAMRLHIHVSKDPNSTSLYCMLWRTWC